jgi:hypothetical protein
LGFLVLIKLNSMHDPIVNLSWLCSFEETDM